VSSYPLRLDHDGGRAYLFVVAALGSRHQQTPHDLAHVEAIATLAANRPCTVIGRML
jgi:hypothetical protein